MATKTKKNNKIAIIGFDCMVKSPKNLKGSIGKWESGGPALPIEFTRISGDGRLTPVIDKNGTEIKTVFSKFKYDNLNRAILEVAKRQGITNNNKVGYIDLKNSLVNGDCYERCPEACQKIAEWAKQKGFSAVVWNGLGRKFKDAIGVTYSPNNAMQYLKSLNRTKKSKAIKYIKSLPKYISTTFREVFNENY